MPDHAREYSFDIIEFTMRANESCFDQFEFGKTLMKDLKLQLTNQKWIDRSVYPCGISEQAFGSRFADGLYRGFYDTCGCNAGYHTWAEIKSIP